MAGLVEKLVRFAYDERKGGVQWGNVLGTLIGGGAGLFMGNYISGAGGQTGTAMGLLATVLLTGACARFGAKLLGGDNHPTPHSQSYDRSLGHAQQRTREMEYASNNQSIEHDIGSTNPNKHLPTNPNPGLGQKVDSGIRMS